MEFVKKQIDVNENNIKYIVSILYGLIGGVIAIFVSKDLAPTEGYLILELIGVIFVLVLGIILFALMYRRYSLLLELKRLE